MAILVSVVAVIAVTGVSAALAARWVEAASRASFAGIQAGKPEGEGTARAYIFSFGLENAPYASPADSPTTQESQNRAPH
jgi:hypothetical protein